MKLKFNVKRFSGLLVLSNFSFITSETMGDYDLKIWYLRVTSPVVKQLKT